MTTFQLEPHPDYRGVAGPLVLAILDGVGNFLATPQGYPYNALWNARTPVLDRLFAEERILTRLVAHGTAVGLPDDATQGNSEVGHNALGAGRIIDQGAKLVGRALEGPLFAGRVWREIVERTANGRAALHLMGLVSDGNVHSHIDHLEALIRGAARDGVRTLYVHGLADGRDVPRRSAEKYFERLEKLLASLREQGLRTYSASGGGRMAVTMDRYNANWKIVERGWNAAVHGRAESGLFASPVAAVLGLRERLDADDQNLPAWVIADPDHPDRPVGPIRDGDAVVFFNFRGDRAIEISRAFEDDDLDAFDRGRRPDVLYAGMTQYDGDAGIPARFLVEPPAIDRTVAEYMAASGIPQFAVSETQKFGHVTYFWHGNNSGFLVRRGGAVQRTLRAEPGDQILERQVEVRSDVVASFAERPRMKAIEVAEQAAAAVRGGAFRFVRLNFANGDMVGHTGDLAATAAALEAVDEGLGLVLAAVDAAGGTLIVTSDHGNAEQMADWDSAKRRVAISGGEVVVLVSHSLNSVPFLVHGPDTGRYSLQTFLDRPGLANVAATLLNLLGFAEPADYLPGLLRFRRGG